MHWIDGMIIAAVLAVLIVIAFKTRRFNKSVADFLASNRCAGRYLLTASDAMVAYGIGQVVAFFEIFYTAGFTAQWWALMLCGPIQLLVQLSGWVVYRFRCTRSLTLLQFVELRYSRKFRLFIGVISYVVFLLGIGIVPGVGARFFINICGLPHTIEVLGVPMGTYPVGMGLLLVVTLFFAFAGHITVMVTDFLQGMLCNIVLLTLMVFLLVVFPWDSIVEGLKAAPPEASLVNPFKTSQTQTYDLWFFMIWGFNFLFIWPCFQGAQAYNSAAKTPHEARMARVLGQVRGVVQYGSILVIPIIAFVVMHHPRYADIAATAQQQLQQFDSEYLRRQMTVPTVLRSILPLGLIGAFGAAMLAAMIASLDTMLHAAGAIFVQDVLVPFRKTPFDQKTHMRLLKLSTLMAAVFIFLWSLFYQQRQDIMLFLAIINSFYSGGAAAAVILGLYWSKGTASGAWSALFTSIVLTTICFVVQQTNPDVLQSLADTLGLKSLDSQRLSFFIALASMTVYILVSLLSKSPPCNMDKLLHRGQYALEDEPAEHQSFWKTIKTLGINNCFTTADKVIYFGIIVHSALNIGSCVIITLLNTFMHFTDTFWFWVWRVYLFNLVITGTTVTIWFLIGGSMNLKELFQSLKTAKKNTLDDGTVAGDHNLAEDTA